jgi:PAS domain-containing protein
VSTKGKAFIVKRDGAVLSKKAESSIQSISDIMNNNANENILKSYMKSKNSGVVGFANGDEAKRYFCYSKTEYNNWEIIMVVSSSSVEANISDVTDNFVFLGVIIGLMLTLLIGYFIYMLVAVRSESSINLRRYFMVSKYSEDIVFDYSCVKDTLYCNENWKKLFGYELPKENVKEGLSAYIVEEDREVFEKYLASVSSCEDLLQFKCKVLDVDKNPVECTFKIFGVKDNLKKLIKVVGVIEKNIG